MIAKLMKQENWEQETLNNLLFSTLVEQRRRRRWKTFFLFLFFGYLFGITWLCYNKDKTELYAAEPLRREHIARIDIIGTIVDDHGVAADQVIEALQRAAKAKNCKAVVLRINSPGGSGVQANQIYKEITRLRAIRTDFPVYAVIEDLGASAAYWIASAAEQIYADEVSLVGSIGVLINSFGFVNAMEKVGIERRLYTAGKHKGILDPFSEVTAAEEHFIKEQLEEIHNTFITSVKLGRQGRLAADESIYSGKFWAGKKAKKLGLIDGFGDVNYVAREVCKITKVVDYTVGSNVVERLIKKIGAAVGVNFWAKANSYNVQF